MKTTNRIIINSYGVNDDLACSLVCKIIQQGKRIDEDGKDCSYGGMLSGANGKRLVVTTRERGNTNIFTVRSDGDYGSKLPEIFIYVCPSCGTERKSIGDTCCQFYSDDYPENILKKI